MSGVFPNPKVAHWAAPFVCVVALSLGSAPLAHADKKSAAQHYRSGSKAYNLGRFEEAIVSFEKAYEEDPAAILLFNIAQSHRQVGKKDKAVFFYRRYLEADPGAANRPEVERRMRELTAELDAERSNPTQPPTAAAPERPRPADATTTPNPATDGAPDKAADPALFAPADEPARRTTPLRIGAYSAFGAGALALGAGTFFGMRAKALGEDNSGTEPFDAGKDSAGRSAETFQYVFVGVGAAALATGGVLLFLDRRHHGTASVALSPTAFAAGAGVLATGKF